MNTSTLHVLYGENDSRKLGVLPLLPLLPLATSLFTGISSIVSSDNKAKAQKAAEKAALIKSQQDAANRQKVYYLAGGSLVFLATVLLITRNKERKR
jgi:hypothetical protein